MKKFKITETRLTETKWTYEIGAETEADALEQIFTGQAAAINHEYYDTDDDSQFDVDEIENDIDGMVDGQYIVTIDKK